MQLLGIRAPLICAPMGGVAGGQLASAVSHAGGLGMIGMGSSGSAESLRQQLAHVATSTNVGIGMVDWVTRRHPDMLELALGASPALLSVCFGETFEWAARAKDAGIPTAVQVADESEARAADRAGIDILVARGREGGGHGKPLRDRDALLTQVLEVTDRPVLAAGAIATRDDVTRVMAAGASGVWVGTAFIAADEALSSPAYRRTVLEARAEDTVVTRVFDRAAGHRWPPDIPERVVANEFTARWSDGPDFDQASAHAEFARANEADDPRAMSINAGTGVGHVIRTCGAAEIVDTLMGASAHSDHGQDHAGR